MSDHHTPGLDRSRALPATGPEYEIEMMTIPRSWSRSEVRRMLAERAEYGRWELARTTVYVGGRRTVWLRRRIIRVRSTL